MTDYDLPVPSDRLPNGRFGQGNPGRPTGSRNRVSARVAMSILEDFEANREETLMRLRRTWLPAYVRLVSNLLPKTVDIGLPDITAFSEEEVARRVSEMRWVLDRIEEGEGSLLDLEAVLLGEGEPAPAPAAALTEGDGEGDRNYGELR